MKKLTKALFALFLLSLTTIAILSNKPAIANSSSALAHRAATATLVNYVVGLDESTSPSEATFSFYAHYSDGTMVLDGTHPDITVHFTVSGNSETTTILSGETYVAYPLSPFTTDVDITSVSPSTYNGYNIIIAN